MSLRQLAKWPVDSRFSNSVKRLDGFRIIDEEVCVCAGHRPVTEGGVEEITVDSSVTDIRDWRCCHSGRSMFADDI